MKYIFLKFAIILLPLLLLEFSFEKWWESSPHTFIGAFSRYGVTNVNVLREESVYYS